MEKIGKAYGFFDCQAQKETIESELPTIRNKAQTPSKLELSLIEGMDNLKGEKDLIAIAKEAEEGGMRYVLEATYPNATNKQTADELASIINQAYQSPLYNEGDPFRGAVVYKQKNRYAFRN